jgi:hypothetical protein
MFMNGVFIEQGKQQKYAVPQQTKGKQEEKCVL